MGERPGSLHGWGQVVGINDFQEKVGFLWSLADLLRGDDKPSEYGKVLLALAVVWSCLVGRTPLRTLTSKHRNQ